MRIAALVAFLDDVGHDVKVARAVPVHGTMGWVCYNDLAVLRTDSSLLLGCAGPSTVPHCLTLWRLRLCSVVWLCLSAQPAVALCQRSCFILL